MRLATATILILALAGCANSAQQLRTRDIQARVERYHSDLAAPSFAILTGEINLREAYRLKDDPCAAIREDRIPTAAESAALHRWSQLRSAYITDVDALLDTNPDGSSHVKRLVDEFNAAMENASQAQSELVSQLAAGQMTYCAFATQDQALTAETVKQAQTLRAEIHEVRFWEYSSAHPPH